MAEAHDTEVGLGLAEGLVNSHLPSGEHVPLDSPDAVARFLQGHGVETDGPLGERDVEEVERLRARLREVFEAPGPEQAVRAINDLLEEARVQPRLAGGHSDGWRIEHVPARASLARRLAARTAMALAAMVTGEGSDRLRVCAWDTCRDVFVDRSRNRSRRFCSPQVCGNRASVAAWRARQRAASRSTA